MSRDPLIISHRTQAGTMPENTLAGIEAALRDGVDGIEFDVRATADRVVALHHDETLERVAGDPRPLSRVTHAELAELRIHARGAEPQIIPTLRDALAAIAGRAIAAVEVKEPGIHDLVAREVREAGATGWTWIWCFDPRVLADCRRALPEVPASLNNTSGALSRFGYPEDPIGICVREGFAAVSWDHRQVTAEKVAEAHRRGLAVYTWTPNEPSDIEQVYAAGVDAICSDFPDRVQALIGPMMPQAGDG